MSPHGRRRRLPADERGTSIALTQVLTVAMTALLVGGLLVATSGYLGDQRERAARTSLETVGERLASELARVDGLSARAERTTLATRHPGRVGGTTYLVRLSPDPGFCDGTAPCLVLRTDADTPDVRIVVTLTTDTPVVDSSVPGGRITVVYDGTALSLAEAEP